MSLKRKDSTVKQAQRKTNQTKSSISLSPIGKYDLLNGDCLKKLTEVSEKSVSLVFSSPPYNIGKSYERRQNLSEYLKCQEDVIMLLSSRLTPSGSICWQTGNYVNDGKVIPLDIKFDEIFEKAGLRLRRRFVWRFGHGLHCARRFSGRYETISWYTFPNFDQQISYPIEAEWNSGAIDVPNVKSNHVEKTDHPCQFPVELAERFVLAFTAKGQTVLDPYAGVGSVVIAAVKNERFGIGIEIQESYIVVTRSRLQKLERGVLEIRQLGTQIHIPSQSDKSAMMPEKFKSATNPSLIAEEEVTDKFQVKSVIREVKTFFTDFCGDDSPLIIIHSSFSTPTLLDFIVDKLPEKGNICVFTDHGLQGFQTTSNFLLTVHNLEPRNRIVMWNTQREQYASVMWLSKGDYYFDLDSIRVPSKYPGKKSPRTGDFSGNPLGKNPSDVWTYCDDACPNISGLTVCECKRIIRAFCPVKKTVLIFMPNMKQDIENFIQSISFLKRHIVIGTPD